MLSEELDNGIMSGRTKSRDPGFSGYPGTGRVHDPLIGQFLIPGNYVQVPDFTQSFNRYGYALNNPLVYTDPDGELVHIVIGAVVGGVINLATNWNNCDGLWEYAAAFGTGTGSGAIGGAAGGYVGGYTGGYLMTGDLSAAHQAGMSGLKMDAGIGAATGFAGGLKYSHDNKINPWTGKPNNSTRTTPSTFQWDLSPDPNGDNVTMYRGLSGNEGKRPL